MKIKARLNKIHRVNPNGILCNSSSLEVVDVAEEVANELLDMGFVEKAVIKKSKKGVK